MTTLQPPLIGIQESPVPPDGSADWVVGAGGARLRVALFRPKGKPRGSVVISPGRSETIEKYFELVCELQARNFVVLVHDWRGQGLSERILPDPLKGHAVGFQDFVADYRAILDHFEAQLPGPWIAMAHSMGGCLTLIALAQGQADRFVGAFMSAPMLGLQTPGRPKPGVRALAWVMSRYRGDDYILGNPGTPMGGPFEGNILTHDRVRYDRNLAPLKACPDLALGSGTWSWLEFAFTASRWLKSSPAVTKLKLPVVVLSAAQEALVDNDDQRQIVARIPLGRWRSIDGAFHELFQETDAVRAQVWAELGPLLDQWAPGSAG